MGMDMGIGHVCSIDSIATFDWISFNGISEPYRNVHGPDDEATIPKKKKKIEDKQIIYCEWMRRFWNESTGDSTNKQIN